MYKVYNENDAVFLTLSEIIELTNATPAQVRKIFTSRACCVNGFEVINYNIQ